MIAAKRQKGTHMVSIYDCHDWAKNILAKHETTKKDYYLLTIKTWLKIRKKAIIDSIRTPVMCIDFEHGKTKIVIFRDGTFNDYRDYYRYIPEETCWSINKSIHVKAESNFRCIFKQSNDLTLVFMPWKNFLKIVKSGVKDKTNESEGET